MSTQSVRRILLPSVLGLIVLVLIAMPSPLPWNIGAIDFRAYWSASHLLVRRENFADPVRIFQVEREQTGWWEDYPMLTWNPPWLLVMLVPYALVPFRRALWWWMLTSIVFVFISAILLWQARTPSHSIKGYGWIAPIVAFAYSPTLIALIAGQVNILVLAGLSGFIWFCSQRRCAGAGAALVLTTVKPHLVYVTIPILLLDLARRRCWREIVVFFGGLLGLSAVAVLLRSTFLSDYLATVGGGNLLAWETPTLGGWLGLAFRWEWAKLIGVAVLPLAILVWSRNPARWDIQTLVDATVLVSIISAPFAWSYDFVVLLVPLIRVILWMVTGTFGRFETITLAVLLVSADVAMFYERIQSPSEVYYFWVPLLVSGIYIYGWLRQRRESIYA